MRLLSAVVGLFSLIPVANAYTVNPADTAVTFQAIGSPGFLRINGESGHVKATFADQKHAVFTVALDEFKTGIDLRDHHMEEKYLETGKYPVATLAMELPSVQASTVPFAGKLTLHGVTKDVTGKAELTPVADGVKVDALFQVNLSDFRVDIPSYLGVTVAETVDIHVMLKAAN